MKPIKIDIIWLIVVLIVLLVIFKQCEGETKTVTKTEINISQIIEQLISDGDMLQGGLGYYSGWIHYDIRKTKARWGF